MENPLVVVTNCLGPLGDLAHKAGDDLAKLIIKAVDSLFGND